MKYKLTTQNGYDLLEVASVIQKSIRRWDQKTALYFSLELYPLYSNYLFRRLSVISAEDCYDPETVVQINAIREAYFFCNEKKKAQDQKHRIFISKAILILCRARKSRESDIAQFIYDRQPRMEIPEYAYDCHTQKGKKLWKTKNDFIKEEQEALVNSIHDPSYEELLEILEQEPKSKELNLNLFE